jgi:hypothetical protein
LANIGAARRLPRIHDRTPAPLWMPSLLVYPERIPPPCYPAHLEVRCVSGTFRLHAHQPFLSHALEGQDIGLEEVAETKARFLEQILILSSVRS